MQFIATFRGINSVLGKRFVRVSAPDIAAARASMFATYGEHWAFLYDTEEQAGVWQYGLTEVPFGTPNTTTP